MSKMLTLKQEKKYQNQTINVLTRLNSGSTIHRLDKSIKTFKTQRQQVQSSRAQNTSMFNKKENRSIQSQSKNGQRSYKSTKKNSMPKYHKNLQQSIESRLKKIKHIFKKQTNLDNGNQFPILIQSIMREFEQYQLMVDDRKQQMLYDDFDYLISGIIHSLQNRINRLCETMISDQYSKIEQFRKTTQKIITQNQKQLANQAKKMKKIHKILFTQIQNMTIKSLYTTEKINMLQYLGIINFQKQCKSIDGNYVQSEMSTSQHIMSKSNDTSLLESQQQIYKEVRQPKYGHNRAYTQGHQNLLGLSNAYNQYEGQQLQMYDSLIKQNQHYIKNPYNNKQQNGKIKKQMVISQQISKIKNNNLCKQWNKDGNEQFRRAFKDKY